MRNEKQAVGNAFDEAGYPFISNISKKRVTLFEMRSHLKYRICKCEESFFATLFIFYFRSITVRTIKRRLLEPKRGTNRGNLWDWHNFGTKSRTGTRTNFQTHQGTRAEQRDTVKHFIGAVCCKKGREKNTKNEPQKGDRKKTSTLLRFQLCICEKALWRTRRYFVYGTELLRSRW